MSRTPLRPSSRLLPLILAVVLGPAGAAATPTAAPRSASAPPVGSSAVPAARTLGPSPVAADGDAEADATALGPPVVVWTRDAGMFGLDPTVTRGTADAAVVRVRQPLTLRITARLDAVAPFPWREAVRSLAIGCRPVADLDCPGGVVERGDRVIVSPSAARWSDDTLVYVLRHELAHVWQHATGDLDARRRDLDGVDLGPDVAPDLDPLEAAADCLAAAWGSPSRGSGYLTCPPAGVARMAAVAAALPWTARPGPAAAAPQATAGSRPARCSGTTPSSTARTAASVRPATPSLR